MAHILPNTDQGLITADNSVVVFIDHQPQMLFGVGSGIDRQQLVNNVVLLARGAKEYNVPTILTTVETESFSGQCGRSCWMYSRNNSPSNGRE